MAISRRKIVILVGSLSVALAVVGIVWDFTRDKTSETRMEMVEHDRLVEHLKQSAKSLGQQVRDFAGNARCSETVECRVMGLGPKICDGYSDFIFYSIRDAQKDSLLRAVDKFNATMSQLNDLSPIVQNCGKPDPEVRCVQGRCVGVE